MTPSANDLATRLAALYPVLAELPPRAVSDVIEAHTHFVAAPGGTTLFDEGSPCLGFPMVLSGSVRVARGSPAGRMLELYRVTPGELCVVSTACLFSQTPLSAHGHAVEATELVLLLPQGLDTWCQHAAFRRFVFGVFGDRLADLMELAEAVAFQRLDQRLAQALLGHGNSLQTTHQALADSLGTVREIVSRLLSRFERAGWVRLSRERIDLLDSAALRNLAGGQGWMSGS
ncbi:MAG: Crp/Fnr family transcriptional regulator [Betaproteobacteria bacterium]|nr:Crp/Fnr family transcriptional regulator [Betaproteobacteria bacterium]